MAVQKLISDIFYIGVDDKTLDLFEGQYIIPNGISYNSYVIKDEKVAVMDTVDIRATDAWLENLSAVLVDKSPNYLIVSHMEPDHAGSIQKFIEVYPDTKIIMTAAAQKMMGQFFPDMNFSDKVQAVGEGTTLSLGKHTLRFILAPMVHWPEVMMTYDETDKILFSADAFGKFGALDTDEDWACEARRYYFNIVGKYGPQVQAVLKKATTLDIQKIFPLHGPMLTENLSYYLEKYNIWSSYQPEDKGVFIAYASIYGNTKKACELLKTNLEEKGVKVAISDLARDDMAECLEDAFRYDRLVLAAPTYDAGVFPVMETFIAHLKSKNYQNRKIALIENGSWAPQAAKKIRTELETLKDIVFIDPVITIKSAMTKENEEQILTLAENLCK